jgi:CRISPR-associated protein Cas2
MTKKHKPPDLSEYRAVWLFAMFDLPVDTAKARREYTRFRKYLLREGFSMLQFSVYARYCRNEERSKAFRRRLRDAIPPEGEVRLLAVTDHQFGKMEVYLGKKRRSPEKPPDQLMLF